jgi:hypothetical protein
MAANTDSSFIDISPFFTPGVPSSTLPITIAQSEIGGTLLPDKLLAEEQIGPKSKAHRDIGVRFSPYQKINPFERHRSQTPTATSSRSANTSDMGLKGSSSDSPSDDEHDDDNGLIPKPEGEAGRPGRGGYNLEDKLGWERKRFLRVKARCRFVPFEIAHLSFHRNMCKNSFVSTSTHLKVTHPNEWRL